MTAVALFLAAAKLAGVLAALSVAANLVSFSRYRRKNLRQFRSPVDESADVLATFDVDSPSGTLIPNPRNLHSIPMLVVPFSSLSHFIEGPNLDEKGFFFGLATAPAHVEDKLDDAWLQFAEEHPCQKSRKNKDLHTADAVMASASADGGSQQATVGADGSTEPVKRKVPLKLAMEAMIRGFEKYSDNTEPDSSIECSHKIAAWHNVPQPKERLRFWSDPDTELKLAKDSGISVFRMGIDWTRIMPKEPQTSLNEIVNFAALERYRSIIERVHSYGMKVMLTLFHHSLPPWAGEYGGWKLEKTVHYFMDFTRLVVDRISDLVDYWVTFNEPHVFCMLTYCVGAWPGGNPDMIEAATSALPTGVLNQALHQMAVAHSLAYDYIHNESQSKRNVIVGIAHHVSFIRPYGLFDVASVTLANSLTLFPYVDIISDKLDFLGINYYGQEVISGPGLKLVDNNEYSESGRGVYPDGLFRVLHQFHERYKHLKLPFIITENGISDETDLIRRPYILEHLLAVYSAIITVLNLTLLLPRVYEFLVIYSGQHQIIGSGLMDMVPSLALSWLIVPITLLVCLANHTTCFPRHLCLAEVPQYLLDVENFGLKMEILSRISELSDRFILQALSVRQSFERVHYMDEGDAYSFITSFPIVLRYEVVKTGKVTKLDRDRAWSELYRAAKEKRTHPFYRAVDRRGYMLAGGLDEPIHRPYTLRDWRFGHYEMDGLQDPISRVWDFMTAPIAKLRQKIKAHESEEDDLFYLDSRFCDSLNNKMAWFVEDRTRISSMEILGCCGGNAYARNHDIPVLLFPKLKNSVEGLSPTELVITLREFKADFNLLAGYLRLIPMDLVQAYPRSILNNHPSLLLAFGGKGFYGLKVLEFLYIFGLFKLFPSKIKKGEREGEKDRRQHHRHRSTLQSMDCVTQPSYKYQRLPPPISILFSSPTLSLQEAMVVATVTPEGNERILAADLPVVDLSWSREKVKKLVSFSIEAAMAFTCSTITIILFSFLSTFSSEALNGESDRVFSLPGQPHSPAVSQYSGYVTVNRKRGRALFYWFFEAQHEPRNKPLLLWLNGGLMVSFSDFDSSNSWEKKKYFNRFSLSLFDCSSAGPGCSSIEANLLFLESPVGVGFSYSNTSSDFSRLEDGFVGHYVPQLAEIIYHRNKDRKKNPRINLKGFLVGNPETDDYYDYKGLVEYAWSHSVISDQLYSKVTKVCNFKHWNWTHHCNNAMNLVYNEYNEIDIYNIYAPKCTNDANSEKNNLQTKRNILGRMRIPAGYDPCFSSYVKEYFNRHNVQRALHAARNPRVKWKVGGRFVEYKGLTMVTVRGAGHLVPLNKPREAFLLMNSFLHGQRLPTQKG
ncbi:Beta-glucosidase-like SFR2, chloroplastic [Apostasia shenzhenica]|uniref:Beta-glucosidase-like SFR2, chloroplastic n=1 Tax=Apostasia shenzhenica TaxID=1088818 RepID=A0A2I0A7P5_9ASPA|nr:Beta-glucosidase-like SFR2, chloroplastic [Apostasia shenzhenica]